MKPSFSILLIGLAFTMAACNTVQGMGKDIERAGEAIQRSTK